MRLRACFVYLAVTFVLLSLLAEEVEGRRKVLQGRKAITRKYYRGTAIPAWSIVVLVGTSIIIVGGVLYVGLKKFMFRSESNSASV